MGRFTKGCCAIQFILGLKLFLTAALGFLAISKMN